MNLIVIEINFILVQLEIEGGVQDQAFFIPSYKHYYYLKENMS